MATSELLSGEQFSELYDYLMGEERFGPAPGQGSAECDHTLHATVAWLKEHGIQAIPINIEKIVDLGGHCDCEVLFNVDPETWKEARNRDITGPNVLGEGEWQQFLSDVLRRSGVKTDASD